MIGISTIGFFPFTDNIRLSVKNYAQSLERISSGRRINSTVDDPSGAGISAKFSANLRKANSFQSNIQNGLSFLEVQDSVLAVMGNILVRMLELNTLANDSTKGPDSKNLYQEEYVKLQDQFKNLCQETYNGINIFNTTSTPSHLFISHPEFDTTYQISRPICSALSIGDTLKVGESEFSVVSSLNTFSWESARIDALAKGGRLAVINSLDTQQIIEDMLPSVSRRSYFIDATDIAQEGVWLTSTGQSLSYTNWGSSAPNNVGGLEHYATITTGGWAFLGFGKWNDVNGNVGEIYNSGYILETTISLGEESLASDISATIDNIARLRAINGAEQKSLIIADNINKTVIINNEHALAGVLDVDIARESTELIKSRIKTSASVSILSYHNINSSAILRLLE
jgi:flagellin-like hook-associated protein FlgL